MMSIAYGVKGYTEEHSIRSSITGFIWLLTAVSESSSETIPNISTVKPVLGSHSKRRPKLVFYPNYRLMQVKRFVECSIWKMEHSAILSTFIKLSFVKKTFVLSIFEWPLKAGFTVDPAYIRHQGLWVVLDQKSPIWCVATGALLTILGH